MAQTERIDLLLVARGLAASRSQAQRLVMAGKVRADGAVVPKPSAKVRANADLSVAAGPRFVSRGGEKLEAALSAFPIAVEGIVAADVGASTGGFTDCLLQRGARRVYAIDVGQGILHWKLREDPRVVVMENTNARLLASLPETVGLVTVDASFISLRLLLPRLAEWLAEDGDLVALVKPQFEAGKGVVSRGGVVREPEVHRDVLHQVLHAALAEALAPVGLIRSPLLGPKGNVEFLLWCRKGGGPGDPAALVDAAVPPPASA